MGRNAEKHELLNSIFSDTNRKGNIADGNGVDNALAGTFSDLIDVMDIAMWQLDLDYRVVGFNKKAKEIYGENALGNFCYCVAARRDRLCELCPARMVYEGQASGRSGHKRTDIKGREIFIDHIATPIKNTAGDVTGSLVLIIDITHHKAQEKELLEHRNNLEEMVMARTKELHDNQAKYRALYEKSSRAEKLYLSLLNSSADAIVIYNLNGEVQYLSPSFTELFGWRMDELKGKRIPFVPESEKESTFNEIRRVLATGKSSRNFQTKRSTKDGRLLDIYISASKYDDNEGNPVGLLVILKDVTDTKAMEIQLQRAQKMDALGTLAGGIAHDFNNVLTAVMGLIEMEYLGAETGSRTYDRMEKALAACGRARDLVKQILTFSTRGEQRRKPLHIGSVVEDALQMMQAILPTTIVIQTDLEEGQAKILGDYTQIHQIIVNLCTNAAHSMRRGGGILGINLKEVEVDDNHSSDYPDLLPGCYLRLTVRDTGEGMDRRTRERIFEPFFTTKPPGEGAGVGLSVVHGIVKSHNGKIVVRSEPGNGSTFELFFPRVEGVEETEEKPPQRLPVGNERILLVDDEEIVIAMTSEMLGILGYEVVAAQQSSKALEIFRSQPDWFQLIITDQTMPGMTGMELTAEILRVKQDIPIILCTGYSNENIWETASNIGIRKILSKPFVVHELASSVRDVLDQG
jgi:PAS domain S-box-containing protein